MRNSFSKYAQIALVIILLIIGALYYFYANQLITKQPVDQSSIIDFNKNLMAARNLYSTNGDNAGFIETLEKLLSVAPTKDVEALLKMDLASAYSRIGDNPKQIKLFKEIVANQNYSKNRRAYATQAMADSLMLKSRAPGKLADEIFSGEPYVSFRKSETKPGTNVNILTAIQRLYEYASSIYPLPVSEYRIAEWGAKRAISMQLDKTFKLIQTSDKLIIDSIKHIGLGDSSLEIFDSFSRNKAEVGYAMWVKGTALGILGELKKDPKYIKDAETAFKDSFITFAQSSEPGLKYTKANMLWADFYYAAFLSRTYGKIRASDIKVHLANITNPEVVNAKAPDNKSHTGLIGYLDRLDTVPMGMQSYDYQSALALAKIDSKFAELLVSLGWKI